MLLALLSKGKTQVSTDSFVKQLTNFGHVVTDSSLVKFLENNPLVDSATTTVITLKKNDGDEE